MTSDVIKKLNKIYAEALEEVGKGKLYAQRRVELEIKYLGRKGKLNDVFKEMAVLSDSARKEVGVLANKLKSDLKLQLGQAQLQNKKSATTITFDETIPGARPKIGSLHPITQFLERIMAVFSTLGFEIVEDREVETTVYNFDKLNIAFDHPARDMWDTFYIKIKNKKEKIKNKEESSLVLRTHTSPVQIRAMEKRRPPVRLVVPGRVYRHEATDASHETNFYQLEGLVIDRNISVANMIYVLHTVLKQLFGDKVKIRIRPSFFPFVEPGHEVDMSCIICEQKGCSVCSGTGWLEMLGAGMVHPVVLKNMKVDPDKYSGFAFGMGVDRLIMLYHGINDIRLSYSGDLRFLKQF
ncbi:MAG: phenylalanine--tRNA ligase subunit alpha [Candidatus Jacksonbacteria bacterium RIFOXYC2_FULL_44_29]|nr:MAG: Phenylalanine-tRNA ligase alpha subunit [Parcubacteria group bacterium GW2011_GWA2_42_28]KKT56243.1 MAG: Phenylalanine-tRNA ligase alpha subunit [Parcubacteria group bacterium GW2011_GWC2_44_22]OGY76109.1 MAG: phenylalanine--tRNA ligase subunit alpha [Candidatus Jacksonbacteria bacterium RIFOXYA2_FULL_43_12]OGY77700.1 MAG: phenylalanine--tRNA ligase subunit alpha [Candidatus Jacksonbacteria bacterium RIFOXYB2_FULL_44_15]OGY78836.1 MAG: phenylalanine--tRNA ligase subunit alpha [Candidatu